MKISEARQGLKGTPPRPALQLRPRTHRWRLTGGAVDLASRIVGLHLHGSHGDVILLGHLSSSSTINIRYKYIWYTCIWSFDQFHMQILSPHFVPCTFQKLIAKISLFFSARVFFFFSVFCFRFTVFFFFSFFSLAPLTLKFCFVSETNEQRRKSKRSSIYTCWYDSVRYVVWFGLV